MLLFSAPLRSLCVAPTCGRDGACPLLARYLFFAPSGLDVVVLCSPAVAMCCPHLRSRCACPLLARYLSSAPLWSLCVAPACGRDVVPTCGRYILYSRPPFTRVARGKDRNKSAKKGTICENMPQLSAQDPISHLLDYGSGARRNTR